MGRPSKRSALACLTKKRLVEIDRTFGIGTSQPEPKDAFIEGLAASKAASFAKILEVLSIAELKHVCRAHEMTVGGTKSALAARIQGLEETKRSQDQTSLQLDSGNKGGSEEVDPDLAAFLARSRPSVGGIIPRLAPSELTAVLRRLEERHGVVITLSQIEPGVEGLADALESTCSLPMFLSELTREQLGSICRHYALEPIGTGHGDYIRTLLAAAAGITHEEADEAERQLESEPPAPDSSSTDAAFEPVPPSRNSELETTAAPTPTEAYRAAVAALPRLVPHRVEPGNDVVELPRIGELVRVRQRQYLVSDVTQPEASSSAPSTLVTLVCLDDDAQGRELQVLWELELGAKRVDPAARGLGDVRVFDAQARFAAYYHSLQWNCVTTATRPDAERVQAPFRAGIAVMQHQLVPLQKVLSLPRANLFVADDVGLGKTIEAGLILQEMKLRQRLDMVLIVCPASICLQWQTEMELRFGLRFEIVNRSHVARIRRERGFSTNPWACGRRFIVSYQTLRRPEYQESLLSALGARRSKSMLILDEAHTVAPANAQGSLGDSKLTKLARALAPRFENRLFLSATPHNGHSQSFSALLEMLDPTRFKRGVPVQGSEALEPIMVRRLKRDLAGFSALKFPERKLIELRVTLQDDTWTLGSVGEGAEQPTDSVALGASRTHELALSDLLAQYTDICSPTAKKDRRVFIGLQKRLLSSCAAFASTLQVHSERVGKRIIEHLPKEPLRAVDAGAGGGAGDDEVFGQELDLRLQADVGAAGALPSEASARARAESLLSRMQELCASADTKPEAKLLALVQWIRRNQCPAAGRNWFETSPSASKQWSATRLIVFTEYSDTATYLISRLRNALDGTARADDRVAYFHGTMSDDQRRALQAAFNAHPDEHPVRILIATDAAREGVNFQAHCADLIHYDIPWNPGRLEQRNGRIDRTLQPSPEVRCMYFTYPQRREDRVLKVLVGKVGRIKDELGSLSTVVFQRMEDALEPTGIDEGAQRRLDLAGEADTEARAAADREIEATRQNEAKLRAEIERAGACYERSRSFFAPDADGLRETLRVALQLAGASDGGRFLPTERARRGAPDDEPIHYEFPQMPADWQRTLDTLRPPKPKDQWWDEWRRDAKLKPVVFEPLTRMTDDVIQLHLEHPLVRRALARFSTQGYAAHDVSRACLMPYAGSHERLVIVARLSLFGAGATRLHDSLVHLVAGLEDDGERVAPASSADAKTTIERMRAAMRHARDEWAAPSVLASRRLSQVHTHMAELWPTLDRMAQDEAHELERLLDDRGAREAEQLSALLTAQREAIEAVLAADVDSGSAAAARRRTLEHAGLIERLEAIATEIEREPRALREHYRVLSTRIEAVGMIYLVPGSR